MQSEVEDPSVLMCTADNSPGAQGETSATSHDDVVVRIEYLKIKEPMT